LQFADIVNRYDFIDNIVRGVDRRCFQIGVCVRSAASNIEAPDYGEEIPHWIIGATSRRDAAVAAVRLAHVLRRWRADILHTHHYDQALIGWMATRIYPRTRLVIGRHYSDSIYRSTTGMKRRALLALEQVANRAAARIVVPSTMIRDLLVHEQGIDAGKVDVILYGFAPEKYNPSLLAGADALRKEIGLEGKFVLGNFARLHEEKGQRYLLTAMAALRSAHPQLRLLIAGEGPERTALERQLDELDLRGIVTLLGWRRDAMKLMAAVDAVVQPTLQEAFSQVMAEALWMQKPLVVTRVSGATDIIEDQHNGLLVPKQDPSALASSIDALIRSEPLRQRLSESGRRYVEESLAIPDYARKFERLYRSLAE
jgi:glycosyltransferase involved in cell wall biosynthesis